MHMILLENTLPDELMSGGTSWGEQMAGNKPPAQGPGPGPQQQISQMNGEEVSNIQQIRMQHQQHNRQLHQLMQQHQVSIYKFFSMGNFKRIYFEFFFKFTATRSQ